MAEAAAARQLPARRELLAWLGDRGVYVALALLVVFNLAFTANFATVGNLRLQLVQVVPVAIVALGMALVIGTEGIDLSVGSIMAIAAALVPLYLGYGPWVAIGIALLAGGAVGLVNGGLVAFVGVQPIVATLGMLVAGRGIALVLADGRLTELFDPTLQAIGTDRVAGIPITVPGGRGRGRARRAGRAAHRLRPAGGRDRRQPGRQRAGRAAGAAARWWPCTWSAGCWPPWPGSSTPPGWGRATRRSSGCSSS